MANTHSAGKPPDLTTETTAKRTRPLQNQCWGACMHVLTMPHSWPAVLPAVLPQGGHGNTRYDRQQLRTAHAAAACPLAAARALRAALLAGYLRKGECT
jgi:hypothetical protein